MKAEWTKTASFHFLLWKTENRKCYTCLGDLKWNLLSCECSQQITLAYHWLIAAHSVRTTCLFVLPSLWFTCTLFVETFQCESKASCIAERRFTSNTIRAIPPSLRQSRCKSPELLCTIGRRKFVAQCRRHAALRITEQRNATLSRRTDVRVWRCCVLDDTRQLSSAINGPTTTWKHARLFALWLYGYSLWRCGTSFDVFIVITRVPASAGDCPTNAITGQFAVDKSKQMIVLFMATVKLCGI